jgi:intein/homing endonuclease
VSTPQGDKSIETLKPGDSVFSFNELTGEKIPNTVEDSPVRTVSEYYIIRTRSGREVKTTAEHPFFTGITTNQLSTATPSNVPDFIKFLPSYVKELVFDLYD